MTNSFWIGYNTPSSKNNRQWTGEYFVSSELTQKWRKFTKHQWLIQKQAFLDAIKDLPKPIYIELTFARKGRHKFDYINACQTVQDEMKYHGWITDDNADHVKPFFGDYIYDKNCPGLLIRIIKTKPIFDYVNLQNL